MFENDGMFGNPDVQEDFAIYQTDMDTCMVCAETTLINQFLPDLNLDQYQAAYISAENGWYQPGYGTPADDMGNLMESFGISTHTEYGADISQLASELRQGHGVIVGVNAGELWDQGPISEFWNYICDVLGWDNSSFQPADHAITVTGIDTSDPANPQVIINDSGDPNGAAVKYPLDRFLDAWENSNFQYTATDEPLPSLVNDGIKEPDYWGDFNWDNWILSASAGVGAGLGTLLGGGDLGEAVENGLATGVLMNELLNDDDFARMV